MAADALRAAAAIYAQALPVLLQEEFGVNTKQYEQALRLAADDRFVVRQGSAGRCGRFAAYVVTGDAKIYLCPQFFTPGAEALRTLTVLHELVHVVAGPDECRAMAFAARIQFLGTGAFTPVTQYWTQNQCEASRYRLPSGN